MVQATTPLNIACVIKRNRCVQYRDVKREIAHSINSSELRANELQMSVSVGAGLSARLSLLARIAIDG
jgi:hypothetical protein